MVEIYREDMFMETDNDKLVMTRSEYNFRSLSNKVIFFLLGAMAMFGLLFAYGTYMGLD